ncbi:hypothetical protein GCM10017667_49610 [Streptomyces filamentosus]|uniref:Uncharacterized protein n=1 Tax=Streptomyces filamentosus TaxID=67294 RepID=A0A919BTA9_STRFL|nr:hypothetical protein GCM10017667_49610 [Streptomyces filamentosus]
MRRRHRDVPVCVTWTVPCAMGVLCPRLVRSPLTRIQDLGSEILDLGFWIRDPGSEILDPESKVQDPKFWIVDRGSAVLDPLFWTVDPMPHRSARGDAGLTGRRAAPVRGTEAPVPGAVAPGTVVLDAMVPAADQLPVPVRPQSGPTEAHARSRRA